MAGDEVEPRFKPEPSACPCKYGCGVVGQLVKRTFKDGTQHTKGCTCPQCRGRKSKRTGAAAQRSAARSLGIPQLAKFLPGHEENFPGELRVEVKSGGIVRPMATAFRKAYGQSEAARPIGDNRPIVVVAKPEPQGKDGIVAFRISDLTAVTYALALHLNLLSDE